MQTPRRRERPDRGCDARPTAGAFVKDLRASRAGSRSRGSPRPALLIGPRHVMRPPLAPVDGTALEDRRPSADRHRASPSTASHQAARSEFGAAARRRRPSAPSPPARSGPLRSIGARASARRRPRKARADARRPRHRPRGRRRDRRAAAREGGACATRASVAARRQRRERASAPGAMSAAMFVDGTASLVRARLQATAAPARRAARASTVHRASRRALGEARRVLVRGARALNARSSSLSSAAPPPRGARGRVDAGASIGGARPPLARRRQPRPRSSMSSVGRSSAEGALGGSRRAARRQRQCGQRRQRTVLRCRVVEDDRTRRRCRRVAAEGGGLRQADARVMSRPWVEASPRRMDDPPSASKGVRSCLPRAGGSCQGVRAPRLTGRRARRGAASPPRAATTPAQERALSCAIEIAFLSALEAAASRAPPPRTRARRPS